MEISEKAAQAIVYAINFHLEEQGLTNVRQARLLAIALAGDVKRIMAKELNPAPELGTADVYHNGTKQHYRARLLEKITPEQFYYDPMEGWDG